MRSCDVLTCEMASYLSTSRRMISQDLVYTIFVQPLVQLGVASLRLVVYSMTTMVGIGPHVFGCVIYFWVIWKKDVVSRKSSYKKNNSKLYSAAPRYAINQTSSLDDDAPHVTTYLSAFIRRDRHCLHILHLASPSLTTLSDTTTSEHNSLAQWMQKDPARARRSSPKCNFTSWRLTISRRILQQEYVSRGSDCLLKAYTKS